MSAQYNLPLHVSSQNGDDYVIDDGYPHDGATPPGMGWDGQSDGGGKFRLKRRRRCGQCGPCQVKENCNKCQYCMRKDVLKQACVYRKCVYLRKPVPRFRQESASTGGASRKSAPTPPRSKSSSTPVTPGPPVSDANTSNNSSGSVANSGPVSSSSNPASQPPNPAMSSSTPAVAAPPHPAEFSSCRLNQSPFVTLPAIQGVNNGVLDPLRQRILEPSHRSLFDHQAGLDPSRSALDPSKTMMGDVSRFPAVPAAPSLSSHCKLDKVSPAINHSSDMNPAVTASLNSVNSALSSHHTQYQSSKCPTLPHRDPYFSSMDAWSSMPYALPHTPSWAAPTLTNHPAAAAAYGFQQHSTPFQSSFPPSSCRLGMPDPAGSRFVPPAAPQHSFHHSMTMAGLSQDFTHSSSGHVGHANMRAPVNPPFYSPPSHLAPSSLHSFPGLSQFPTGQAGFGPAAYSMHPHAHMYPSSFYPFRTATEPQIYHVEVFANQNPFRQCLQNPLTFLQGNETIKKDKQFPFELLGTKNSVHCITEDKYFENFCSLTNQQVLPRKQSILPLATSMLKMLRAKCFTCYTPGETIAQTSHIPHNVVLGNWPDNSGGAMVSVALFYALSIRKAVLINALRGVDYANGNKAKCCSTDSKSKYIIDGTGNTELSPLICIFHSEIYFCLLVMYHFMESDSFLSRDDGNLRSVPGRSGEQWLDLTSGGDDRNELSLKESRKVVYSCLCVNYLSTLSFQPSTLIKTRSAPAVCQSNISAALMLPAAMPSSLLLPPTNEHRDMHCDDERETVCAKGCSLCLNWCQLSHLCHENNCLNNAATLRRNLMQEMPCLKSDESNSRQELDHPKPCLNSATSICICRSADCLGIFVIFLLIIFYRPSFISS